MERMSIKWVVLGIVPLWINEFEEILFSHSKSTLCFVEKMLNVQVKPWRTPLLLFFSFLQSASEKHQLPSHVNCHYRLVRHGYESSAKTNRNLSVSELCGLSNKEKCTFYYLEVVCCGSYQ